MHRLLILILLCFSVFASPAALADRLEAFHNQVNASYSAYRAGWYYLRTGSAGLASLELGTALDEWQTLVSEYKNNPPTAFKGDTRFASDLDEVARRLEQGLDKAAEGDNKGARGPLKPIRDILYDLRKRNSIRLYADCVTELNRAVLPLLAYRRNARNLEDGETNAALREDAERYIALFNDCLAMAPAEYANEPEYTGFMEGFDKSVNDMPKALDAKDAAYMVRILRELLSFDRIIYFRYGS